MNIRLIHVAVALAVLPAALLAQEDPAPATPPVEEQEAAPAEGTGVTGEKGKETLSVDFPNAEIRTILRNIADLFDLNLVIPETLEGRASLKLREVTWRQIFDVLLQPIGYTYVTDGNIIKIVTIDSQNVEPPETRIYILNYARAADIATTISSMVEPAKGGKLQVETRSNALVVTERPKRHEQIQSVITRLDRATDQVMIETKFVEISDRDQKDLGVRWASLNNYNMPFDPTPALLKTGSTNQAIANDDGELLEEAVESSTNWGAVLDPVEFSVVLSALETKNETRLVSNPTVVTLNNQEALISIGEQFPIPSYRYSEERGTFEVDGFEYKDIGIIMKVTPQVNNAGLISLKISPEVSSRNGTTSFGGASSAEIPIIATRRTTTQVALKDGYTMAIGGLIESTDITANSKVPLLGDIPGLGRLFRSDGKTKNKRNLIVFITAKILPTETATYRDVFSDRKMEEIGVSHEDAPLANE